MFNHLFSAHLEGMLGVIVGRPVEPQRSPQLIGG